MTDHADILRRLEAAKGADREIDRAILRYLGFTWRGMDYWNEDRVVWKGSTCFTYSLDAAIALVEKMLPGWRKAVIERGGSTWEGAVSVNDEGRADKGPHRVFTSLRSDKTHAPTPAIALLIALFRALEAGK